MKKFFQTLLRDIGIVQTLLIVSFLISFIFLKYILKTELSLKENNFFNWLVLIIFFISSIRYVIKFRPRSITDVKGTVEYKKIVSLLREVEYSVSLITIYSITVRLISLSFINPSYLELLSSIAVLIISIRLQFSTIAIILGVPKTAVLLLILIMVPVTYMIGIFDISWWAIISGLLMIWNFINSKDFLSFQLRGYEIKKVPESLNFKWHKNRLAGYCITTVIYIVLIVSNFFEKKGMSIIDRANVRLYTVIGGILILLVLVIIFSLMSYLYGKNDRVKNIVDELKKHQIYIKTMEIILPSNKYLKILEINRNQRRT